MRADKYQAMKKSKEGVLTKDRPRRRVKRGPDTGQAMKKGARKGQYINKGEEGVQTKYRHRRRVKRRVDNGQALKKGADMKKGE